MKIKKQSPFSVFLILLFSGTSNFLFGQETIPFSKEVQEITKKYDSIWDSSKNSIVFTGSSSVRKWKDLPVSFPQHQIINTGFGGSQASDLLYHLDALVLKYNPEKVFIYEGDNDINAKKKPKQILQTTQRIIAKIKDKNPNVKILLISAKPSISRWKLKGKYKRLNRKFKHIANKNTYLEFVDVWTPMLNGRKLKKDIFIADGLHMNQKGYELWYTVIKNYINKP